MTDIITTTAFELGMLGLTCLCAGFVAGLLVMSAISRRVMATLVVGLRSAPPPPARLHLHLVPHAPVEPPDPADQWKNQPPTDRN